MYIKDIFRMVVMFIVGFCAYVTIEVLYRGYSYALMGLMGGIVFILVDNINEKYGWNMDLLLQAFIGGVYATLCEFLFGLIDISFLHIYMWNYSDEPFNIAGIVCLKFSLYWCVLALFAILIADFINYCIYRTSQRPYYMLFGHKWVPCIYNILD